MDVFIPIQWLSDWITYGVFGLSKNTSLASTLNFFIYDTIKILLLLVVIIFIISIIQSYFPPERTKRYLSRAKYPAINNFLAALLGIVTPFCSCSAVPLFIGFIKAGVPLGVTFSFLISAPMVNEVALVLLWGLFGWKIALIYVTSGIVIATIVGWVMGNMNLEKWVESFVFKVKGGEVNEKKLVLNERIQYAKSYTVDIIRKVWLYVIIGVGLGALMHGYIPNNFLASITGSNNPLAVPLATIIGIPLYSNAAGTIPIVSVLIDKGMSMGTALAFMMAVTALSLPEFIILRRVLKSRLIVIYASIVGLGIIFTGYLFNAII